MDINVKNILIGCDDELGLIRVKHSKFGGCVEWIVEFVISLLFFWLIDVVPLKDFFFGKEDQLLTVSIAELKLDARILELEVSQLF